MENTTVFDVMYEVDAPVANVWEARLLAQSDLAADLNHGPVYEVEAWDAEIDNVQFRVTVLNAEEDVNYFYSAVGSREVSL